MSKKDSVFGKRVMCFGYMQKQKLKHVEIKPDPKAIQEDINYDRESVIYLSDYGEPIEQYPYKLNTTIVPFMGFIIGKKKLKTAYFYDIFYGPYGGEDITCEKYGNEECYVVAYQMGKKRYVPVNRVRFALEHPNEENVKEYLKDITKRISENSNQ